jgi:hypothetical protein
MIRIGAVETELAFLAGEILHLLEEVYIEHEDRCPTNLDLNLAVQAIGGISDPG